MLIPKLQERYNDKPKDVDEAEDENSPYKDCELFWD